MDNKIKYVDLNGLKVFAEALKQDLKNHVLELGLYQELLHRIENLELYKIVDSLPKIGDEDTIYLLKNPSGSGDKNVFIEYLYNNEHGWEEIGNFTPSFDLEDYLKIENASFEKGGSENSAVLKDGNNIAGLKGWYYKAIQFNTNTGNMYLYLTQTQQVPRVVTSVKDVSNPEKTISFNLPNGTVLSIINDVKYDNQFRLTGNDISKYGRIIVKPLSGEFPFNDIKTDDDLNNNKFDSEDYSVYSTDNPLSGIADMGEFSVSIGLDNKATNNKAISFGYNNHSYGKFSFTEGRDNKAAYCSHAEGKGTQANGLTSHSEGAGTQANGDMSHAEGKGTITTGKCSHAEGRDAQAIGANSHSEGQLTVAIGNNSHVSGYKTVANNNEEAAFGRFNESNENTRFSIGIGTSEDDRKNAFEVKENGDIYIEGFEKPVQTELTELSTEVGKKVDADKIATINGKSLINGGKNIVIEGGSDGADSPVGYGDAEHSAVLKGEYQGYSNKAISQTSMAVGAATTAGLKGWHYSAIDFTNNKITLSDRPTYILADSTLLNGGWSSGVPNIKVDDVISLVNDSKYDLCSKVIAVNGNVITVDSLPFVYLASDVGAAAAVLAGQFSDGYSVYIPDRPDAGIIDFGGGAFSEGGQSKASNICSHAEGLQTHAYGQYSHTEGRETKAGYAAHAEGYENRAFGNCSHAEGHDNEASGNNSHAEGVHNVANGNNSHAEGNGTKATDACAHAEGFETEASGLYSHAEGCNTLAKASYSHAEGKGNIVVSSRGHVEGELNYVGSSTEKELLNATDTITKGFAAHAEGQCNIVLGNSSHAEGIRNKVEGDFSHAEGKGHTITGKHAHAEGSMNTVTENQAHAEGYKNKVSGMNAHVEGQDNIAGGDNSHVEGQGNVTSANRCHAEGRGTQATNTNEHACGKYNKSTKSSDASQATHFSIGIGTSDTNRKNAFEVKQNGDIYIEGVKGRIQDKLNGGSSATPDWNAREGEAGYIKNKPFNLVIQNIDFELYDEKACAYISDIYEYDGFCILDKPLQFNGNYNFTIDYYEGFEQYNGITIEFQSSDILVTPNHIDTYVGDTIEGFVDYCNSTIKLFKIKVIDALFIPDTVVKTTPQILSDEDKNQALANLGIDPVVWKYLCNPCVIKDGEQVPEDLLGNQDTFKYTNRGMYIVYDEGSGSTYTIEKITSTEMYLYAGGYVAIINGCWEFN